MGTRQAVAALVAASVAALASCSTLESTPHEEAAGASMAQPEPGSRRGGRDELRPRASPTTCGDSSDSRLPTARSRRHGHRMRPHLHAPQTHQHLNRLAGQRVGIKEVDEGIWIVSFMHYDLGYIDLEQKTPATSGQPVRHEVVAHVLGTTCYPCVKAVPYICGGETGIRTLDTLPYT